MNEFRKFASNRQVVDIANLTASFGDNVIVCVPRVAFDIAAKLLATRGYWPTTYATGYVDNGYLIPNPDNQDFVRIKSEIAVFIEARDMTCDITAGLQGIERAINNMALSCASNGSVAFDGTRYSSGLSLSDSDGLAAFGDDQAAFDANKCANANSIVSGMVLSLNNLSVYTIANLVGLGAGVGALVAFGLAVPPVGIIAASFALLGTGLGILSGLASYIDDNREDIVCLLYSSETANDAYDAIQQFLEEASIDLEYLEVELGVLASFIGQLVPVDSLNNLFTSIGLPDYGDSVSCAGCAGATYGVTIGVETSPQQIDAVFSATQYWVQVQFSEAVRLTSLNVSTSITTENNQAYRAWNSNETLIYASNTPPTLPLENVYRFTLIDRSPANPFSVGFDYENY